MGERVSKAYILVDFDDIDDDGLLVTWLAKDEPKPAPGSVRRLRDCDGNHAIGTVKSCAGRDVYIEWDAETFEPATFSKDD